MNATNHDAALADVICFRGALEVLPEAVLIHSGGSILYTNKAFCALSGRSSLFLEGLRLGAVVEADRAPRTEVSGAEARAGAALHRRGGRRGVGGVPGAVGAGGARGAAEARAGGGSLTESQCPNEIHGWVLRPTGESIPVAWVESPLPGERAMLMRLRDRRAELEQATRLREAELRHRELFEHSMDMKLVLDAETGAVVDANPALLERLGWERARLQGQPVSRLHPMTAAGTPDHEAVARYRRLSSSHIRADRLRARSGEILDVEMKRTRIRLRDKDLIQVVFRDVTEQRRALDRLHHADKLRSIGELAGGIAHDFNNLLSPIRGYAKMLARKLSDRKDLLEHAEAIDRSGARAAELTRQLLAFARKGPSQTDWVDCGEIIQRLRALLGRTLHKKIEILADLAPPVGTEPAGTLVTQSEEIGCDAGGALEPTLAGAGEDDPWGVRGDPAQIEHALLNLAINARDAMPEGGTLTFRTRVLARQDIPLKVDAATRVIADLTSVPAGGAGGEGGVSEDGYVLEVAVADTGVGMPPEILAHVFEPFFTTKPPGVGTGLGLPGVYGTVKSHGGGIVVRSEPGVGTVFRLLLPMQRRTERAAAPQAVLPLAEARRTGRILILDDDPIVRQILEALLRDLGHRVTPFDNGPEAVEALHLAPEIVDIAFIDWIMPTMDGMEVLRALLQVRPDLPVVVLTGELREETRASILAAGAKTVLGKPFEPDDLDRVTQRLLPAPA